MGDEMPSAQGGRHWVISTPTKRRGGQTSPAPCWLLFLAHTNKRGLLQSREGEIVPPWRVNLSIHPLSHPKGARHQGTSKYLNNHSWQKVKPCNMMLSSLQIFFSGEAVVKVWTESGSPFVTSSHYVASSALLWCSSPLFFSALWSALAWNSTT